MSECVILCQSGHKSCYILHFMCVCVCLWVLTQDGQNHAPLSTIFCILLFAIVRQRTSIMPLNVRVFFPLSTVAVSCGGGGARGPRKVREGCWEGGASVSTRTLRYTDVFTVCSRTLCLVSPRPLSLSLAKPKFFTCVKVVLVVNSRELSRSLGQVSVPCVCRK